MKKAKKLPRKMSALIRVALADLKKVEALPKIYRVKMATWHSPPAITSSNKCEVCFAGAVLAKSLGADPNKLSDPSTFDYPCGSESELSTLGVRENPNPLGRDTARKLFALNDLRRGKPSEAAAELGFGYRTQVRLQKLDRRVPQYTRRTRLKFRRAMLGLARDLEKAGL